MIAHRYQTLGDYFTQTGTARVALAQKLGISKQHLSLIEKGRAFAGPGLALKLVMLTGVRVQSVVCSDLAALLEQVAL